MAAAKRSDYARPRPQSVGDCENEAALKFPDKKPKETEASNGLSSHEGTANVRSHTCQVCGETATVKFDTERDAKEYDALLRTCALALCKNRECIVSAMKTALNVVRDLR